MQQSHVMNEKKILTKQKYSAYDLSKLNEAKISQLIKKRYTIHKNQSHRIRIMCTQKRLSFLFILHENISRIKAHGVVLTDKVWIMT